MTLPTTLLAVALLSVPVQKEPVRHVEMKDGSIEMGIAVYKKLEGLEESKVDGTVERYRAFMSGYFMWRGLQFVVKPYSKLEVVHLNACLQVLDLWSPGVAEGWKPHHEKLLARAEGDLKTSPESEAHFRESIRMPIMDRYMLYEYSKRPTDVETDEFMAGVTLGELSSLCVTQFTMGGHSSARKSLASSLKSVREYRRTDSTKWKRAGMTPGFWSKWDELGKVDEGEALPFEKYEAFVRALNAVQAEVVGLR